MALDRKSIAPNTIYTTVMREHKKRRDLESAYFLFYVYVVDF